MAIKKIAVDKGRRPSAEEVDAVQMAVEQCIKKYMSKTEAVKTLASSGNIQPELAKIIWEMLEERNKEFFRAYNVKLLVKDQIKKFNSLLQEQVELMHQNDLARVQMPNSDGINTFPTQQFLMPIPAQGTPSVIEEETIPITNNYSLPVQPFVQGSLDQSGHRIESGFPPNMLLAQNTNIVQEQMMNWQNVGSQFDFCTANNFPELHPQMGNASAVPFRSLNSSAVPFRSLNSSAAPFRSLNSSAPFRNLNPSVPFRSLNSSVAPFRSVIHSAQNPYLIIDSDARFLEQYHNRVTPQVTADFTNSYGLPERSNRPSFPATDEMLDMDLAPEMMRNPFWR